MSDVLQAFDSKILFRCLSVYVLDFACRRHAQRQTTNQPNKWTNKQSASCLITKQLNHKYPPLFLFVYLKLELKVKLKLTLCVQQNKAKFVSLFVVFLFALNKAKQKNLVLCLCVCVKH